VLGADPLSTTDREGVLIIQHFAVILTHASALGTCGCLLRRPMQEDRGHHKRRVRLSKAIWVNVTATRYRRARG